MMHRFAAVRRWLVRIGLFLLALAGLGLALVAGGVVSVDSLALGTQSGFRSIAEVAVVGCLLAAIGYWNE